MHDLHPFSILNYFVLIWSCACLRVNYNYHSVLINSKQSCEDENCKCKQRQKFDLLHLKKRQEIVLIMICFLILSRCYNIRTWNATVAHNLFSHGKTYFLAAKCTVLRHVLLSQQLKLAAHNKNYSLTRLTTKLKVSLAEKLSLELTANLISHDKTYFLTAKPIFLARKTLLLVAKLILSRFLRHSLTISASKTGAYSKTYSLSRQNLQAVKG